MNYAIIENDVVVNIIVWDGAAPWDQPATSTVVLIPDGIVVMIGSTYDGRAFTLPLAVQTNPF